jgi:hypothetical protein
MQTLKQELAKIKPRFLDSSLGEFEQMLNAAPIDIRPNAKTGNGDISTDDEDIANEYNVGDGQ